jgi:hypothetical protein
MDRRAGPTGSIALDPFFGRQDGLADEWAVIPFKPFHFFGKQVGLTLKPGLSRGLLLPGANP